MLAKEGLIFIFSLISFQGDTSTIQFFNNGKLYEFRLPRGAYKESVSHYTEGVFRLYSFESGETIVLHVGGNQLKPLLREKAYRVTESSRDEFVTSRRGYHKKSRLCWHEITTLDEDITLYYDGVDVARLDLFENSLKSLRLAKIIR